jgi:hypothetical protein
LTTGLQCCMRCRARQNKAFDHVFKDLKGNGCEAAVVSACWLKHGEGVRIWGGGRGNRAKSRNAAAKASAQ